MWSEPPNGMACMCIEAYTWPNDATASSQVGSVVCSLRTGGGVGNYNVTRVRIPVTGLVLPCDWVLCTSNNSDLTIRGSPVEVGSPLAVVFKTTSSVFISGSAIEIDLGQPELYFRGKSKLSMLVIGFYCSKKKNATDAAIYHVS